MYHRASALATSRMIRCPGCGGRNAPDVLSCEWCRHPFVQVETRGRSARWWGGLLAVVIAALLVLVGGLLFLSSSRSSPRLSVGEPTPGTAALSSVAVSPPATVTQSAPAASPALAAPAQLQAFTPTPAPRYARVANTGGLGANLRREPSSASLPVAAVAENSPVRAY